MAVRFAYARFAQAIFALQRGMAPHSESCQFGTTRNMTRSKTPDTANIAAPVSGQQFSSALRLFSHSTDSRGNSEAAG